MVNYARDRGTRAETALADYLHGVLGVEVMRRTQQGGGNDRGDVRIVGVSCMVEIKNTKTARLSKWESEVARQCVNAGAEFGVLVWSPPGLGPKTVDRWIAIEWADSAITPLGNRGALFTGPTTKLAAAVAAYAEHGPLLMQSEGIMRARARHVSQWAADVQEHIARTYSALT